MDALAQADPRALPLSAGSALFETLRRITPALERRAPDPADPTRWHLARIGGQLRRLAQPVTFTPYASARPCSARCHFCSETLRPRAGGRNPATLRPGPDYFEALRGALAQLQGVPLSYSLSGLEMSDDAGWFLRLLLELADAGDHGPRVQERVLYSNGAGFARPGGEALVSALRDFGLSWVELSRHHPDAAANQRIMRFREGEPIASDAAFARVARALAGLVPLRLVCLLQQGGIADAQGVEAYLRWARGLGVATVIFREFSRLDGGYRETVSQRYVESHRAPIERVLGECMAAPWWPALRPLQVTEGYYFWNLRLREAGGMEVVFEASDYGAMHRRHDSGDVYKLVLFADGRLCAGWEPDRDLLWRHGHG